MQCEFEYCIYNRKRLCLLDETWINKLGMCGEFVLIPIADAAMLTLKEEVLEKMASQ